MRKIIGAALLVTLLAALSGCSIFGEKDVKPTYDPDAVAPETREELYSYYDQIKRNMTQEDVEKLFGKGEEKTDEDGMQIFVRYRNEKKSAGVDILYTELGAVYTKILYYNKAEDLQKFSNQYIEDRISEIEDKDPVTKAEEIFGKGLEIGCSYSPTSSTSETRMYGWYNQDGTNFQIQATDGIITNRVLNKPER